MDNEDKWPSKDEAMQPPGDNQGGALEDIQSIAEGTSTYLEKLYAMLEQCPEDVAGWTPNGTAFVVYNVEVLEATILPQFFKPIKFESFARHLNSYGFRKVKYVVNDATLYAFRHTKFMRGQSHEVHSIQRRRRRAKPAAAAAPDQPPTHEASMEAAGLNSDSLALMSEIVSRVHQLRHDMADTKAMVRTLTELDTL
ncbi:Aste57867_12056 [Aphanomyces stellatus]|uniref:Aste57867_12056 protein n=1 Tax=Aphanomyces stellatus TaxID=120398 RepID=A0A485KUK0_9STRA|nr:hypothetical protein As57867_012011 [Aphanomyces stellatus]VFT88911.1 Aste57867_12056 [Aphanomyces stellatus]